MASHQAVAEGGGGSSSALRSLLEGVVVVDEEGAVTFMNRTAELLSGWTESAALGRSMGEVLRLLQGNTRRPLSIPLEALRNNTGQICFADYTVLVARDGTEHYVEGSVSAVHEVDGRVSGAVVLCRPSPTSRPVRTASFVGDGGDRPELQLNNDYVLNAVHDGLWENDFRSGKFVFSDRMFTMLGYEPIAGEAGFAFFRGLTHPDDAVETDRCVKQLLEGRVPSIFEFVYRMRAADGTYRFIQSRGTCLRRDEEGRGYHFAGTHTDITERRLSEQRSKDLTHMLRALREVNRLILHERDASELIRQAAQILVNERGFAGVMILLCDAAGHLVQFEECGYGAAGGAIDHYFKAGRQLPCCALVRARKGGLLVVDRTSACDDCPRAALCPEADSFCIRLSYKDASYGYLVAAVRPEISHDTEEQGLVEELVGDLAFALHMIAFENATKAMEEQLNQIRKIEAVGHLAGAVAHDYNNLLTVIRGYTDLALEAAPPSGSLRDSLRSISDAVDRSMNLTRQLLVFARKQPVAPVRLDLNHAVEGMVQLLRTLAGSGVPLLWKPYPGTAAVVMDPSQLDQLLTNLVANARDAMEGRSGSVTLSLDLREVDAEGCLLHPECVPGDYVVLSVRDEGCGMKPDVRARIFEPFFTTKPKGKGTGMGLSTVLSIAQQNKGFVEVDTAPLRGTTFRIFLPAAP